MVLSADPDIGQRIVNLQNLQFDLAHWLSVLSGVIRYLVTVGVMGNLSCLSGLALGVRQDGPCLTSGDTDTTVGRVQHALQCSGVQRTFGLLTPEASPSAQWETESLKARG